MCGIAGILLTPAMRHPARLAAVDAMTETLRHRGPDAGATWTDHEAGIALGHRRLAIVDLSEAGRQPMRSHRGQLVVSYNGEIYNFLELRAELEAAGRVFAGGSDTEVMLAAFEKYGVASALEKFAGMFAIALWDRERRSLHLMRDRLGKKPLYVTLVDGALLFASELRAFRAFPGFEPRIDSHAVACLLRFGWIPDELCIWQGVFRLPPASRIEITPAQIEAGGIEYLRESALRWWSPADAATTSPRSGPPSDTDTVLDELEGILRTAVRQRMVADVPLGAFLSGGIDSTTVVAMMQACSARPVRTFTVAFHERGYNEADHAGRIAGYLRTDHTRLEVTASEARAVIPDLPTIWDEPFADESQIPTFLISRLARSHVTVALSGDGGDECFGGYRRHIVAARAGHVRALPNLARRAAALALLGCGAAVDAFAGFRSTRKPARRGLIAAGDLRKIAHLLSDEASVALYESLIAVADRPEPELRGWLAAPDVPPMPDLAADIMYRDLIGYLPGDVLVKVDRASMAVALEMRAPLLDHRVVEFALRQPTSVKLRHGTGKWVLRKLLARYVPPALFERPKAGFDVPISAWLAGPLSQWAGDVLTGSALRSSGLVDHARIDAIWSSHRSGRSDRGRELWAVLMLGSWLEQSASRPSACSALDANAALPALATS